MKPTVHYRGEAAVISGRAWLHPVDHPNHVEGHSVSNERLVHTSTVVSHDKESGRIETRNTVYVPEEVFA